MSLTKLTQKIQSLSRLEKLQLIEETSKMLRTEEDLSLHFTQKTQYPVFTPYGEEKAAMQLQQFLKQQPS